MEFDIYDYIASCPSWFVPGPMFDSEPGSGWPRRAGILWIRSSDLDPWHVVGSHRIRDDLLGERIGIDPFFDLGVPIGEREAAGPVVVVGRHVPPGMPTIQKN